MEVPNTKVQIRSYYRQLRNRIATESGQDYSKRISKHFPKIEKGRNVAVYIPMDGEVDTTPLMTRLEGFGARFLLPVVISDSAPLSFFRYTPGDELVVGPFKNAEPKTRGLELVPDILVIPVVAFDMSGGRIGQGGGFYDRSLEKLRKTKQVLAIGLAYDEQKHDSLPLENQDQCLDMVVTEQRIYDFRKNRDK